jgi:hypothetical protein
MVTPEHTIQSLLKEYFDTQGLVTITSDGVVDVHGMVDLIRPITMLPVQFGHVEGHFYCHNILLKSLVGAPVHVGGDVHCNWNSLINLTGAPSYVGGDFNCTENPLVSLVGAPDHVGGKFMCTYSPHLPLLRLLNYARAKTNGAPYYVKKIMAKYTGQGKRASLSCAAELIRAGYKDNARW